MVPLPLMVKRPTWAAQRTPNSSKRSISRCLSAEGTAISKPPLLCVCVCFFFWKQKECQSNGSSSKTSSKRGFGQSPLLLLLDCCSVEVYLVCASHNKYLSRSLTLWAHSTNGVTKWRLLFVPWCWLGTGGSDTIGGNSPVLSTRSMRWSVKSTSRYHSSNCKVTCSAKFGNLVTPDLGIKSAAHSNLLEMSKQAKTWNFVFFFNYLKEININIQSILRRSLLCE